MTVYLVERYTTRKGEKINFVDGITRSYDKALESTAVSCKVYNGQSYEVNKISEYTTSVSFSYKDEEGDLVSVLFFITKTKTF